MEFTQIKKDKKRNKAKALHSKNTIYSVYPKARFSGKQCHHVIKDCITSYTYSMVVLRLPASS